ncbi:MAG: hypothetical protein H6810_01445 [Phycisphaeraceae bacterium]|nr:MAG: hypothetical protein H6810_01445 [Phycisphaeraceae bacterium]
MPESSDVNLPVLDPGRGDRPRMERTKIGPWRAGVLIAVQAAMAVHIIQWWLTGRSLGAVEPSEAMYTLEQGQLTAGAIFLALALLSVLIAGRYMCGWTCHIIALQDFCHWLMRRLGIRPKPFRSRLLLFVPLILGLYMFVWPTFKRVALQPAFEAAGLAWPYWLRHVEPFYGIKDALIVDDLWANMPAWYIAVPFLLICGFATVYFLGAKAFCAYACPYGGLFGALDPVSPVRVRVDHDKCKQCGHCTAACTSNVRVHEEIKAFGMVVDPGCMKTMDCISVCPNDALSIAPGRPALGAKIRPEAKDGAAKAGARRARRYDLTWPGEIAAAVVFFILFTATRGMLDQVPMLMAGGLAAVGTGLSVLAFKTLAGPNARIHGLHLKAKGKLRPAGALFVVLMLAGWVVALWGGIGNTTRWRAETLHAAVGVPIDAVFRPEFAPSPTTIERARDAIRWYALADSFEHGGVGWKLNYHDKVSLAYLHTVLGEKDQAVDLLTDVALHGKPTESLVFQLLNLQGLAANDRRDKGEEDAIDNATQAQISLMRKILEVHPEFQGVRLRLAQLLWNLEQYDDSIWDVKDPAIANDPDLLLNKGQILVVRGDRDGLNTILNRVIELEPDKPETLFGAAQLAFNLARPNDGQKLVDRAIEIADDAQTLLAASRVLGSANRLADAKALADRAVGAEGAARPGTEFEIGKLLLAHGEAERGVSMMLDAAERLGRDPWQRSGVAFALVSTGIQARDQQLVNADEASTLIDKGLSMFGELVAEYPDEPVFHHDYAGWLFHAGRRDEAAVQIVAAANAAPTSVILADRASQLLASVGRNEDAAKWKAEAEARKAGNTAAP